MSKFNFDTFNTNRDEIRKEVTAFDLIPSGKYTCRVRDAEIRENNKGTGEILSVQFEVSEGEYERHVLFDHLNILHENPQAEIIGLKRLDRLCQAAGIPEFTSADELLDQEVTLRVRLQQSDEERNIITRYIVADDAGEEPKREVAKPTPPPPPAPSSVPAPPVPAPRLGKPPAITPFRALF